MALKKELTQRVMFSRILQEIIVASHADTQERNIFGKRNSKCKSPEVERYLACSRILKKTVWQKNQWNGRKKKID